MPSEYKEFLAHIGIETLNDMQLASIAQNKKSKEILLLSPTGSGKTLAYLLPLVSRLIKNHNAVQALIVVPSRELAKQIDDTFKALKTGFRSTAFYGGQKLSMELGQLTNDVDVIVATPGRLVDHLNRNSFEHEHIHSIILDEFDKSLQLGFHDEMSFIFKTVASLRHKMLTSATEAVELPAFLNANHLEKLNFLHQEFSEDFELKLVRSSQKDKLYELKKLICTIGNHQIIVFCNHRDATERIGNALYDSGIFCEVFHGGMEQHYREFALMKFKNGSTQILVATDLAARGLDIDSIKHVIHYHLPVKKEEFTHRNGRTARMHAEGSAYLLLSNDESIPDYIDNKLPKFELDDKAPLPDQPKYTTLYLSAGKSDKINKVDVVGFLCKMGGLVNKELGMVTVQQRVAYAAVDTHKAKELLTKVKDLKIKGKKVKMGIAD